MDELNKLEFLKLLDNRKLVLLICHLLKRDLENLRILQRMFTRSINLEFQLLRKEKM